MAMTKMHAHGELTTGETWAGVPVMLTDKMAYERTARAQHWPSISEQPLTFSSFVSFAAAKRVGILPADMTWPAFLQVCVEAVCLEPEPEAAGDDDTEGPTNQGPSTL